MHSMFVLTEKVSNGYTPLFLNYITIAALLAGLFVIISKNPIVSVLFLIGLFLTISGYLMMLGLNFIGLSYLLVYVGAVSILFLFILMLINVRISELGTDTSNSLPLAVLTGILFNYVISIDSIFYVRQIVNFNKMFFNANATNLLALKSDPSLLDRYLNDFKYETLAPMAQDVSYVAANTWDASLGETSHITILGDLIYTNSPLLLIITSIILLLAMVGAIVITIKQKG